jgi:hypothetical protein
MPKGLKERIIFVLILFIGVLFVSIKIFEMSFPGSELIGSMTLISFVLLGLHFLASFLNMNIPLFPPKKFWSLVFVSMLFVSGVCMFAGEDLVQSFGNNIRTQRAQIAIEMSEYWIEPGPLYRMQGEGTFAKAGSLSHRRKGFFLGEECCSDDPVPLLKFRFDDYVESPDYWVSILKVTPASELSIFNIRFWRRLFKRE